MSICNFQEVPDSMLMAVRVFTREDSHDQLPDSLSTYNLYCTSQQFPLRP